MTRKIKCGGCTDLIIALAQNPKTRKQLERQIGKKKLAEVLRCER